MTFHQYPAHQVSPSQDANTSSTGRGRARRGFVSIMCTCIPALAIGQTIKDTIFTQLTGGSNIGPLILCPSDFHGLNLNGF